MRMYEKLVITQLNKKYSNYFNLFLSYNLVTNYLLNS